MTRAEIFNETDNTDLTAAAPELDVTDNETNETDNTDTANKEATNVTENADTTKSDDTAAHEASVTAFEQAVEAAVEASDATTGTVPEANLDEVANAYTAVTGGIKYKNAARKYPETGMKEAISDKNYMRAVALNEISDRIINLKAESRPAGPKVDPKVAFGQRVAALIAASEILQSRVPEEAEGFDLPPTDRAVAEAVEHLDWAENGSEGEAPELGVIAAAAVKLIAGKGLGKRGAGGGAAGVPRGPYTGVRRNVAAHIEAAFANVNSGDFLTVSEIAKADSEEYGDDHPSSGAVNARLFPGGDADKCNVEGIKPGYNEQGVKGATKV